MLLPFQPSRKCYIVGRAVPAVRPRSLILTVLGAYIRRLDDWISIAVLIRLMDELGVDEQSVRSAVSRLKRRGVVVPERRDGVAGYTMSAEGLRLLEAGDVRIYGRPQAARLEDGWVVAVFSVPDSRRADRHVLRSRLVWLGFGNLSPAVWIAPAHVAAETTDALLRLGLDRYVHLFRARYEAFGTVPELVRQSWDLDALRRRYAEFRAAVAPVMRRAGRTGTRAFADHVTVLGAWRPLPFLDPGLPVEALPADWPGTGAWEIFHELVEALEPAAIRYVSEVARQPTPQGTSV
jgi:phenylacetic acid degradation operon negative regulatory protein